MMDLRYHLASLMSVFLALTVGIVVGISLGSSERQAATIQHLQQDVAAIRSEDSHIKEVNTELLREISAREEAEKLLLPTVVHGRLSGRRVALLLVGDAAQALQAPVTETLSQAGADLLVLRLPRGVDSVSPSVGPTSPSPSARTGQQAGATHGSRRGVVPDPAASGSSDGPTKMSDVDSAAAELTRGLLEGRPALLDEARARLQDAEVSGVLRAPIRRLLLICPNDRVEYATRVGAGNGVEAAVARMAQSEGATLVAAEPESRAETEDLSLHDSASLLPALAGLGAATVDNIDAAVGQIAAVLALSGVRGSFGTGVHASQPLPPLDEGASTVAPSASHPVNPPP